MRRRRRPLLVVFALLGAIAAFGLALAESVVVVRGGEWDVIENCYACLKAISFASPDDGWAVGDGSSLLHYHDGRWTWADIPRDAQLSAITMLSPDDGWAVGYGSVILHYSAGAWRPTHDEGPSSALNSISMATPTDGWAVGSDWSHPGKNGGESYGLLMHYSGGAWTSLPLLPHVSLAGVAMVSPDDGWAVGSRFHDDGTEAGVILHYQAGQWTPIPSPVDATRFSAVAMRSPDDGWIVGIGAYLHYHDGAWTPARGPGDVYANDLALSGADGGLISAWSLTADGHFGAPRLLQLADDAWRDATLAVSATALSAVAIAPGGAAWLLAESDNPPGFGGRHGVLLRGAGGQWTSVEIPRKPLWPPLALLLPFSALATAALCLALAYAARRVYRMRAAAKGTALRILAMLAFLFAILLALEGMQVAALVYPGSLVGLQPLLFAVVLAASLAPVVSLLVGGVTLVLRIRRAIAAA